MLTLKPPAFGGLHIIVVIVEGQVLAEEIVEVSVEAAARHFGRVEELECA